MKKILLAIILCLPMSSITNAEGAWVLWEKIEVYPRDNSPNLEPVDTFPKYEQCLEAQRKLFEKLKKSQLEIFIKGRTISQVDVIPYGFISVSFIHGESLDIQVFCLEDTISQIKSKGLSMLRPALPQDNISPVRSA